jgi:lysozyme
MTTPFLIPDLEVDEGCVLKAYPDPDSPLGLACRARGLSLQAYAAVLGWQAISGAPWTIGYGHTGSDIKEGLIWTLSQAQSQLAADVAAAEAALDRALPWWRQLSDVRQDVLANMTFNMGLNRLLGFHQFLAACERGDFQNAGWNMLWNAPGQPTPWSHQVGRRATRLANQLELGRRA